MRTSSHGFPSMPLDASHPLAFVLVNTLPPPAMRNDCCIQSASCIHRFASLGPANCGLQVNPVSNTYRLFPGCYHLHKIGPQVCT